MLRIHQFYAILEFVKVMDFEELSQSLRDDFRLSLFILSLYYFFLGTLPLVTHLSLLFSNPLPSIPRMSAIKLSYCDKIVGRKGLKKKRFTIKKGEKCRKKKENVKEEEI